MIALSRAIRQGVGADPLAAALAFLGHDLSAASKESGAMMAIRSLHSAWPHLGQTVRSWPALGTAMETLELVEPFRRYQDTYRRQVHGSLYFCVTAMFDKLGMTKAEIAAVLEAARL